MRVYLPLCGCLLACAPTEPTGKRGGDDSSTPATGTPASGTPAGTPTGTTTGSTSSTTGTYDCATMPDLPLSDTILDAPRGYNDLVFDGNGAMIGHDEPSDAFLLATDPATATVFSPESDTVYKMGLLSTGEIVANTSTTGLVKISPAGASSVLNPSLRGYGLAVHDTDAIYVATNYTAGADAIARIDPVTGDYELLEALPVTPRAIAFSRDYDVLYIGTTNEGHVYRLPLDANGDPTGPATLLVTVPDAWHDTVEVDACGNLYVGSVFSTSIFRVNSDLSVDEIIDWPSGFNGPYGHGLTWGDATGGWNDHAIYVTHPYIGSRVSEWDLGVPGAHWPGTVVGGSTL